jgi:hypothetical protein
LKNNLAGLAIFGIKEIDLYRRGGVSKCVKGEKKKHENKKGSKKLSHSGLFG